MAVRTTIIGAALAVVPLLAAQASGQPVRRPGLWDAHVTSMAGDTDMDMQMCVGVERPGDTSAFSPGGPGSRTSRSGCGAGPQISPTLGGGMSYHIICHPSPQMTMESTGTVTGDFRTSYTIHAVTTMKPSPHGMAPMETTVSARYLGQCPAGMNPGEHSINGRILRLPGQAPPG